MGKICLRATCYIEAKEVIVRKRELEKKEAVSSVTSYSPIEFLKPKLS